MVGQLKQVPALISLCTAVWNTPGHLICGAGTVFLLVSRHRSC